MSVREILQCCFDRWFGRGLLADNKPPAKPRARREIEDLSLLDRLVPRKDALDRHNGIVRREAILSRDGRIAGYEFSLITGTQQGMQAEQELTRQARDEELLTRMTLQGRDSLLGRRLAFMTLAAESLNNLRLNRLPPQNTVLVLHLLDQQAGQESLLASFERIRTEGFRLGLIAELDSEICGPVLEQVDFILIDVPTFNGIDLRTLTRKLRAGPRPEARRLQLVARNVQSHDDYQFCSKCGFDLFQGPFVASRESLKPASARINRTALLPILSMVMSDGSFAEIADQLRREPIMSYKLLRYLNSAAMGLQKPAENLTEALVLIGREKFYRWVSLLIFDFAEPDYQQRLLAECALTRGRTLELLAGKGMIPNDADRLFLLGLFSLLEESLGRPLPELLAQAALPQVVSEALLGNTGPYADALNLAALGEADSPAYPVQLAAALQCCGIADADFLPAATQALTWANQMLDGESSA